MQQISTEGVYDFTRLGGQGDPLRGKQKLKFDHTSKWYMHNPTAILENDTPKLPWDLDIETDHLISARRSDLMIIINNIKENLQNCGHYCHGRPQNKTEGK